MNKYALVLFLGIVMIASTVSISFSEAFLPENLPDVSQASQAPLHVRVIEGENIIAYARPLYTSLDDPSNHEVPTSDPHDGVAKLILTRTDGTVGCSGTLANDRVHVFTAAHCVTDNNGNYILTSGTATFEGNFEGNSESIGIAIDANPAESKAHPEYDGDFIKGNDIAVLKLTETAPLQIPGIPHATADNSVTLVGDKNGYGLSGFFSSGADRSTYPFGTERDGQNKYDAFADTMYVALGLTSGVHFIPEAIYQYDSDDGNSPHDAFGFFFEIDDLGLTSGNDPQEVISAPGDSGGPTILGGELVGVTSYGITLEFRAGPPPRTSDCTTEGVSPILDSSCGEFAGDTRVSHYTDFIDSVLSTTPQDPTISIDDVTQAEGDFPNTTNFVFTVTRSSNVGAISVDFATSNDSATAPSDYTALTTTTLSFDDGGSLTDTITVVVNGDDDIEPDETFFVDLTTCVGCTISDSQGVGTITNDDFLPSISIDDVTQAEGDAGTTSFTFTITRSDNTDAISVDYATSDGTATLADTDYTQVTTTTVNFSAGGSLTQQVTIDVIGDTTPEPDETFNVDLSSCSGCTISDNQGVGTITNDDTPVGVSVDSILPTEIAKGTTLSVEITGSGFQSGASVTFENGCGPSPSASNVSVSGDGKSITADITTKSGGPNKNCTFDVRVTNPDASTDVLPQSFTVLP